MNRWTHLLGQAVDRGAMIRSGPKGKDYAAVVLSNTVSLLRTHDGFPPDTNAVWLRPDASGERLVLAAAENPSLPPENYRFGRNDGLAGKTWSDRVTRYHDPARPHADFAVRGGCMNAAFACVPVGRDEAGGVLGVGSDAGFTVTDVALRKVTFAAALLGLCGKP